MPARTHYEPTRTHTRTHPSRYNELFMANGDLIREYMKRATNHKNLLGALKTVNLMIQKAVRLFVRSFVRSCTCR